MNDIVKVNSQLPAVFNSSSADVYEEFSQGVMAGFPIISYRGKVWRVKKGGEEQIYLDEDSEAVQSIELVLVKANPNLAKIFYEKNYVEGDTSPPRCWSADGTRPDATVQQPISAVCAPCPNNVWGSKITQSGKKTRACADHRRMVVAFRHDIEQAAVDSNHNVAVLLLRVPPASLNPLRDYIEGVLKPKGVPPYAVFTRIGFDASAAHPQLTFKGVHFLNEEQGQVVMKLRQSDDTKRILAEATEYSGDGITDEVGGQNEVAATSAEVRPAKSAPSPSTKPSVPRPVELEEVEAEVVEDIAPSAPSTAAAANKKPKAKAKQKPQKAVPEQQSFDDMLNSLLDT